MAGTPGRGAATSHQRSDVVRVLSLSPSGVIDVGIQPLSPFLDVEVPDAVAFSLAANASGQIYPALYLRQRGAITEKLLDPHPLMDFRTPDHRRAADAALQPVLRVGVG